MFQVKSPGSFAKTERFLKNLQNRRLYASLASQARLGVEALARATPKSSGETSALWSYTITKVGKGWQIVWTNSHVVDGNPLVIMLQYGHGTGTGGYVAGRDFINPAMKPVFDRIADNVWKEVQSA